MLYIHYILTFPKIYLGVGKLDGPAVPPVSRVVDPCLPSGTHTHTHTHDDPLSQVVDPCLPSCTHSQKCSLYGLCIVNGVRQICFENFCEGMVSGDCFNGPNDNNTNNF